MEAERSVAMTVALIGNPGDLRQGFEGRPIDGDGLPYGDLPKITCEAENFTPLYQVLAEAGDVFGVDPDWIRHGPFRISFYQHHDELGYQPFREATSVWILDDEGGIRGREWFRSDVVTVDALMRAARGGVLDGDPRRPYLILRPGGGNGLLPSWAEWVVVLKIAGDAIGVIANAGGATDTIRRAYSAARRLSARIRGVPEVIETHQNHWEASGLNPHDLRALIELQPRESATIAKLLRLSIAEAEAVLTGLGYIRNQWTGLWSMDLSREGVTLNRIQQRLEEIDLVEDSPEGRERVADQVQRIVREEVADDSDEEVGENEQGAVPPQE